MGEANSAIRVRVAAVILDNEQRLLVVRQNHKPFWVLPGGTLELGETLETCLVRELEEELNLTIQVGPLFSVSEFISGPRHVVDTAFWATVAGGTLTMTDDENLNEVAWVPVSQIDQLPLMPDVIAQRIVQHVASEPLVGGVYLRA